MRRSVAIICLIWVGLALNACRPLFERPVSATTLALRGEVTIRVAGKKQPQPLTNAFRINPGAKIATAAGARADLMLLPGLLVEIGSASEVELLTLHFAKDGDDPSAETTRRRTARLSLLRGAVDVFLLPSRNRKVEDWLEVETGGLNFHAEKGTIFRVRAEPDRVRLSCAQGAVVASADQRRLMIAAGQSETWLTAHPPTATAQTEPLAAAELSQILSAAYRQQQLQLHLRNTVPPWR